MQWELGLGLLPLTRPPISRQCCARLTSPRVAASADHCTLRFVRHEIFQPWRAQRAEGRMFRTRESSNAIVGYTIQCTPNDTRASAFSAIHVTTIHSRHWEQGVTERETKRPLASRARLQHAWRAARSNFLFLRSSATGLRLVVAVFGMTGAVGLYPIAAFGCVAGQLALGPCCTEGGAMGALEWLEWL